MGAEREKVIRSVPTFKIFNNDREDNFTGEKNQVTSIGCTNSSL